MAPQLSICHQVCVSLIRVNSTSTVNARSLLMEASLLYNILWDLGKGTTSQKGYQMRDGLSFTMGLLPDTQNCGCACAGNAGNVFPVTAGKRSRHACRDACRGRYIVVSFEIGGGGKRSRHSRRMRNPYFYVSGKRPMDEINMICHN